LRVRAEIAFAPSNHDQEGEEGMRNKGVGVGFLVILLVLFAAASIAFAGPVYDRVNGAGVVQVGLMYNSIPAAYFNDKNEWVGFDVDIAEEVVKRIGGYMGKDLKLERVKLNNKTRISFLTSGRIDMSIANMTPSGNGTGRSIFPSPIFLTARKSWRKRGNSRNWRILSGSGWPPCRERRVKRMPSIF